MLQVIPCLTVAWPGKDPVSDMDFVNKRFSANAINTALGNYVDKSNQETIGGIKTFTSTIKGTAINLSNSTFDASGSIFGNGLLSMSGNGNFGGSVSSPVVPTTGNMLTNKTYVDAKTESGTYVPVITQTNGTNFVIGAVDGMYSRVGNIVNVSVAITLTSWSNANQSLFGITLPIATIYIKHFERIV
ncbi:hypothetical protein [Pedobacter sp. NJ-S-72]